MKRLAIVIPVVLFGLSNTAQGITRDGKYVCAIVDKSKDQKSPVLVVKSTEGPWLEEVKGARNALFTSDNKRILYLLRDTLWIQTLADKKRYSVQPVSGFSRSEQGNGRWIVFRIKNTSKLHVYNLDTRETFTLENVQSFKFNQAGTILAVERTLKKDNSAETALEWFDLSNRALMNIWIGSNASVDAYGFAASGNEMAFMTGNNARSGGSGSLWFYRKGLKYARLLANDNSPGINPGFHISDDRLLFSINGDGLRVRKNLPFMFSKKGTKLFFYQQETYRFKPARKTKYIWSYMDSRVLSQQEKDSNILRRYLSVLDISTNKITQLENENQSILEDGNGEQVNDEYAIICQFKKAVANYDSLNHFLISPYTANDFNWNNGTLCSIYLLSLSTSDRKLIKENVECGGFMPNIRLSPGGRYILYYDFEQNDYFAYDLSDGHEINVTNGCADWRSEDFETAGIRDYYAAAGGTNWASNIILWSTKDNHFVLKDHEGDYWTIDPSGRNVPQNITNGYSKKHSVSLNLLADNDKILEKNDKLLFRICGRPNDLNRYCYCGLFLVNLGKPAVSDELLPFNGPYSYDNIETAVVNGNKVLYFSRRQNTTTPPSYCYTTTFKDFVQVTSSQSEQRTGVQTELLTWKTFNGNLCQGYLIKPNHFDSTKKNPVIVKYYEKSPLGGALFQSTSDSYWANYLTFIPDIHFTIGETGPDTYDCVVSGVEYLKRRSYVDGSHIGVDGGSFGGFETNYLVTHTDIFAAAISACGASDFFSLYLTEDRDESGYSYMAGLETGQYRLGVTPWERPDLYVRNSPVFYADRVTTPILLLHSENDYRVPFSQGVEFFTALRRLGKRVWLISDKVSGHPGPAGPYSHQFFDYYLKGAALPRWMVESIPYREQGKPEWFQLDTSGRTPQPGSLMQKNEVLIPRQKELLQHATQVNYDGLIEPVPSPFSRP